MRIVMSSGWGGAGMRIVMSSGWGGAGEGQGRGMDEDCGE